MKKIIASLIFMGSMLFAFSPAVGAIELLGGSNDPCVIDQSSALCKSKSDNLESGVKNIVNALLFIIGIISVIVIIIAGITFATANGNPELIKKAKNTILYSVIGLIVSLASFAIVNFVLTKIG